MIVSSGSSPSSKPSAPAAPAWLAVLPGVLLSLGLYAVTLAGPMNIYDDQFLVLLDRRVKEPPLWKNFWVHGYFEAGVDQLYRPLASQSLGLQWWLHGNRPWAFHLFNLLLHAGIVALTAELARRLAGFGAGLIAGLLFAVHPVHVEAVTSIVGRTELLCAIGFVGALVLAAKGPMTAARAFAIFALSVVSMLSKEPGMLLPLCVAALLLLRRSETGRSDAKERQALLFLAMLLLWADAGLIVFREQVIHLRFEWDRHWLDWTIQPLIRAEFWSRLFIPVALLGRYFALLICPRFLSIDYGEGVIHYVQSPTDPYLWLGVVAMLIWLGALRASYRTRNRAALFCLIAMAVTYSMASNFIIIGTIFGERLIYLPSVFFLILVAMALARHGRKTQTIVVASLLLLGSLRTFTYAREWNNRDAFYAYSLDVHPRSARLRLLCASAEMEKGHYDRGRQILHEGQAIVPDYWEFWLHLGSIDEYAGDWAQAVSDYGHAVELHRSISTENLLDRVTKKLWRQNATRSSQPPGQS